MERVRFITADGSTSFRIDELDETYHSQHGALTESLHVYIRNGLAECTGHRLSVFEMGLGTALNASLTWRFAESNHLEIDYFGLEKYPLSESEYRNLEFGAGQHDLARYCQQIHQASWDERQGLSPCFSITKKAEDLRAVSIPDQLDLVFFDAFAPDKQPELWTPQIFSKLFQHMKSQAIFVTYSAKGQVRRDLLAAGFLVERLPGPPGNRQMIRARKP